jgi:hypothetical protein
VEPSRPRSRTFSARTSTGAGAIHGQLGANCCERWRNFIGKEVDRRAQEGEDISVLENPGPIGYQAGQRTKTRAAHAGLILRAKRFSIRRLMRESGVSQHAIERFLSGARLHPATRARMAQAVQKVEREAAIAMKEVRARRSRRASGTDEDPCPALKKLQLSR